MTLVWFAVCFWHCFDACTSNRTANAFPLQLCADIFLKVTVTIAQQEGVGTVNDAPALGDEVKDPRTLAREKKMAEKQKSVEEYRATQAEIEKV